jgi:heme exporter protein C
VIPKLERLFLRISPVLAGVLFPVTLWAVFYWVPTDAGLGLSQRIFYYHVPSALTSFVGFAAGGIASAVFLKTGWSDWDHAAHASIGVAMVFATILLLTGSIWARTAWGTWWTWDARLTTFLVLWLLFASYSLLRSFAEGTELARRYAAVLAVVSALNIPIVMMATRLWRTIHPQVINNPSGGIQDPAMKTAFTICLVAFLTLFTWLWALRVRVLRLEERVEELGAEIPEGAPVR